MRCLAILTLLAEKYPDPRTLLHFDSPFQLLIATILSAQCTDTRVNQITKELFYDHPSLLSFSTLTEETLIPYIRSAGLWQTKARNILKTVRILMQEHQGMVPKDREKLEKLPGVGRKTANVLLSNAFSHPAIAVDTHVFRVTKRLGLATGKTPLLVEKELMEHIPREWWTNAHHYFIFHGRDTCKARKPLCDTCILFALCPYEPS